MTKLATVVLTFLMLAQPSVFAMSPQDGMPRLTNKEVVEMVKAGLSPEVVVAKIKVSRCNFDTDPSILGEMRHKGVPNEVLRAMIEAPYGPPASAKTQVEGVAPVPAKNSYCLKVRSLPFKPLTKFQARRPLKTILLTYGLLKT